MQSSPSPRLGPLLLATASLAVACGPPAGRTPHADRVRLLADIPEPELPDLDFADAVPESAPRRIVSLIPSCTETLFALGLGERVVGIDRWADHPPAALELPRLGDVNKIEVERILDLEPDLVLAFQSQAGAGAPELLRRAGIRVVHPPTEAGTDVLRGLVAVAEAAGVRERGEALVRHIEGQIEAVRERYAGGPRPRVLLVFERHPSISVATRTSFVHEMIEAAGAVDVSADADPGRHFTYVDVETIVDWDPELIVDLSVGPSVGTGTGASVDESVRFWRKVGLEVRLVPVPALSRPGPRLAASVAILADVIHGS